MTRTQTDFVDRSGQLPQLNAANNRTHRGHDQALDVQIARVAVIQRETVFSADSWFRGFEFHCAALTRLREMIL